MNAVKQLIPFWILDFGFWILKRMLGDDSRSSNFACVQQNGINAKQN